MKKKYSLSRSVQEVKKYSIMIKAASVVFISLVVVTAIAYMASFLYTMFGSFTVRVNKYDMVKQGLTLSETAEFNTPISKLDAKATKDITNISGDRIPADVHNINGSHNGENYIAYTFHLKNVGEDTVTYEYVVNIGNVTKDVDKAVRFKLYKNGESEIFARTRSDGSGAEPGTTEFLSPDMVTRNRKTDFKSGDEDKYTAVIWLEGNDPDCIDTIIGGTMKFEMIFSIIEE